MSKPSANGRRKRSLPGEYHRHNLGGGNVLKAVTRARRRAAKAATWHPPLHNETPLWRAARRKAMRQLVQVANQLEVQEEAA